MQRRTCGGMRKGPHGPVLLVTQTPQIITVSDNPKLTGKGNMTVLESVGLIGTLASIAGLLFTSRGQIDG